MSDPTILDDRRQAFDGATYAARPDAGGYYRRTVGARTVYLHREVWAAAHGPIPDGYHVHHRNGDTADNRLANLELIEARAHVSRHGRTVTPAERAARQRNVLAAQAGNALLTPEERAQAARAGWESVERTDVACVECGTVWASPFPDRARYCGGACKARALRRRRKAERLASAGSSA